MRTDYIIDHYQQTYFVIDSYDQLFDATRPDFTPYYEQLKPLHSLQPDQVLPTDRRI